MRTAVAVATLALLAACSGGAGGSDDTAKTVSREDTCVEVRAGIDEFNDGDYRATVEHFVVAEKLAKRYASRVKGANAYALLDAVEYYADLDPADYPEAARTSESFAKNKAITLGQCVPSDDSSEDAPDLSDT